MFKIFNILKVHLKRSLKTGSICSRVPKRHSQWRKFNLALKASFKDWTFFRIKTYDLAKLVRSDDDDVCTQLPSWRRCFGEVLSDSRCHRQFVTSGAIAAASPCLFRRGYCFFFFPAMCILSVLTYSSYYVVVGAGPISYHIVINIFFIVKNKVVRPTFPHQVIDYKYCKTCKFSILYRALEDRYNNNKNGSLYITSILKYKFFLES
jgi:hypothetical protein